MFTIQPQPLYYVTPKRPGVLECAAKEAAGIHIKCMKSYILENAITKSTTRINGEEIVKVSTRPKVLVFQS